MRTVTEMCFSRRRRSAVVFIIWGRGGIPSLLKSLMFPLAQSQAALKQLGKCRLEERERKREREREEREREREREERKRERGERERTSKRVFATEATLPNCGDPIPNTLKAQIY